MGVAESVGSPVAGTDGLAAGASVADARGVWLGDAGVSVSAATLVVGWGVGLGSLAHAATAIDTATASTPATLASLTPRIVPPVAA